MAISNELSSEIASAMLTARERSPEELNKLKKVLLEVHTALQSMTEKYRSERRTNPPSAKSATTKD